MKMNNLLATTALVVTLTLSTMVSAQQQPVKAPVAPAPVAAAKPAMTAAVPANAQAPRNRFEQVMAQLPPEKAKMYRDAGQKMREKNKPIFDQIGKLQQELSVIRTAAKFDKSAFVAKNAEIEKAYGKMRSNTSEIAVAMLSEFSESERKLVEQLRQPAQQQPRK